MLNIPAQHYQPPSPDLWRGRADSLPGERYFQLVECVDLRQQEIAPAQSTTVGLIGFCSDTGIVRNLGRPGAAQGPNALRSALAKLAAPASSLKILDYGNILCVDDDLETAQKNLALVVAELVQKKIKPLVLGGGHETAWGHYQGLAQGKADQGLGIINFDAHFDLRALPASNQGTSGTPFRQIALARQALQQPFSYFCLGIQTFANTKSLFATAAELGVEYIMADTIHLQPLANYLAKLDAFLQTQQAIYVTLCLDVFANTIAPGVSAPQPLGLQPWQVIALLRHVLQSKKVISFDVVELSPPLDPNGCTVQLAANLVAEYLAAF